MGLGCWWSCFFTSPEPYLSFFSPDMMMGHRKGLGERDGGKRCGSE